MQICIWSYHTDKASAEALKQDIQAGGIVYENWVGRGSETVNADGTAKATPDYIVDKSPAPTLCWLPRWLCCTCPP